MLFGSVGQQDDMGMYAHRVVCSGLAEPAAADNLLALAVLHRLVRPERRLTWMQAIETLRQFRIFHPGQLSSIIDG